MAVNSEPGFDDKRSDTVVNAPLFPLYSHVRGCIRLFAGEPVELVRDMIKAISDQTGTPQEPLDWSTPDTWISERLHGPSRRLAEKIWRESKASINPRYVYPCYLFINRLDLMDRSGGEYSIHERALAFLDDRPEMVHQVDESEGLPKLVALVAERSPAKRADLIDDWAAYLRSVSKFSTPKMFIDTLRRRLLNLTERGLIARNGNHYSITDDGAKYIEDVAIGESEGPDEKVRAHVTLAVRDHNERTKREFADRLMELHPYEFEHFVKALLEAMDYENVEVTKRSGDKGIDVVADYQFGMTEVREVVQVKRTTKAIGRPVLDNLRGVLPYFDAIRGTIITLGPFAKGARENAMYRGAAPVTLVDGVRLIELAVKYQIGVRRKPVDLIEIENISFLPEYDETGSPD